MAVKRFAAIDVGSYELEMKVFELSEKKGIVEIDDIRHVMELGRQTYTDGSLSFDKIEELCSVLYDFHMIMQGYKIMDYRANATSAIREAKNSSIILDRIRINTGLEVRVLSNSEQRFLTYKAIASKENEFHKIIEKSTAIVDVGAGSVQLSLFDEDVLVTTQNIRLGSMRIQETLSDIDEEYSRISELIEELIDNDLQTFQKLFLKDREIKHVIASGDYIAYFSSYALKQETKNYMTRQQFLEAYNQIAGKSSGEIAEKLDLTYEHASSLLPSLMIYKKFLEMTTTEGIWIPGVCLCDGIVASFAEKHMRMNFSHDFSKDIIVASRNIAERYNTNSRHTGLLEESALAIFDVMRHYHGLGKRERLLLQIAAILHDCGKYISMSQPSECSYNIIISSEIIGLSHNEREMIANIVKYNTKDFDYQGMTDRFMSKSMYLTVAKLTAILRIANAMDRSHKQKFKKFKLQLKEKELILIADTMEDISLEQTMFAHKADFFEELYGIRPVLKKKKQI